MCTSTQFFYLGGFESGWIQYGIIRGGFYRWCRDVLMKGAFSNWFNRTLLKGIYTPLIVRFDDPLTSSTDGCHVIQIKAMLMELNNSFEIDLQSGGKLFPDASDKQTVALLISIRPGKFACIVCNTFQNGWGSAKHFDKFPFKYGTPFDISIVCETNVFQIYIDGTHFCSYEYRIPLSEISHMSVTGNVKLMEVERRKPCEISASPFKEKSGIYRILKALDHFVELSYIFTVFVYIFIPRYSM